MSVKSFGMLLIGIGLFIGYIMFAFCDWGVTAGFLANLRYAAIVTWQGDNVLKPAHSITLAQGLVIPIGIISLGLIIRLNIIESRFLARILPFLHDDSNS